MRPKIKKIRLQPKNVRRALAPPTRVIANPKRKALKKLCRKKIRIEDYD